MPVPELRIRALNTQPLNPSGRYVLYWMVAYRRTSWNFSLDRALEWARDLNQPLLILEALRVGYPWASDRLHRFAIDGMADNAARLQGMADRGVAYYPYVEPRLSAGRGLLNALADRASLVITDDYPCFFLPRMIAAAAAKLPVRLEAVDGNGILPLRAADRVFTAAVHFRRWLQKHLPPHLAPDQFPEAAPLESLRLPAIFKLPRTLLTRWPAADLPKLTAGARGLEKLPIDHGVPIAETPGGAEAAERALRNFLRQRLRRYGERSHPDEGAASGLSPYLHFGHIASHQIVSAALRREKWRLSHLSKTVNGKKDGWWGVSPPLESFLDELVTWRELGFNFTSQRDDYDRYESLPDWARQTLQRHERDRREHVYSLAQFEHAQTHDPLWNAAQSQLLREGRIHNYLRMLWGKKIVEWTTTPQDALAIMIELNNKYALDGRDPNSYSGIFWVLGRYDRPWAPERPVFGTVRWMSSENTARKLKLKKYLAKYGPESPSD
jgi:deoxyribodipyrimidine photo-lyase